MTKQSTSRPMAHDLNDDDTSITVSFDRFTLNVFHAGNANGDRNSVAIGNQTGIVFGPDLPSMMPLLFLPNARDSIGPHSQHDNATVGRNTAGDDVRIGGSADLAGSQRAVDPEDTTIGSYNGDGNIIDIGNGNGFNIVVSEPDLLPAALDPGIGAIPTDGRIPGHTDIIFQSGHIRIADVGNNNGNDNTVIIGNRNGIVFGNQATSPVFFNLSDDIGSYNGNENTVDIGNRNGATIHLNGADGLLADTASAVTTTHMAGGLHPQNDDSANAWFHLTDDHLLQSGASSFLSWFPGLTSAQSLKFESVRISVSHSGNNDGNRNIVAIGNNNGITGYTGFDASTIDDLGGSLIGSHNGNGNDVAIGNGNGINLLLDGGAAQPGPARLGSGAHQVIFQSLDISVVNSGNNDGNRNQVAIGNGNGITGGGLRTSGLGGVIGSENGNSNTLELGNDNGVNIHLGANSGVIIGLLSGAATGYWLQDGLGDSWFGLTQQDIAHDFISSLLPRLGQSSLASVTFESVQISAFNSGINDGNRNQIAIGNQNGISGSGPAVGAGSFGAGYDLSVGSYNGNGNAVAIGNGNGLNLYI